MKSYFTLETKLNVAELENRFPFHDLLWLEFRRGKTSAKIELWFDADNDNARSAALFVVGEITRENR